MQVAEVVPTAHEQRLRPPAWLLALSPVASIVWVAAVVATVSGSGVSMAADLTRGQLDAIRVGWVVQAILYAVAILVGAVGMALLNRALRGPLATLSQVAVGICVVAVVATAVLRTAAVDFDEARLGDNGGYQAALVLSYASAWAATVAVILTGIVLRTSGLLRRTGLVVAIIAAALLLLDVVTEALPPWLLALYWLAFGIGLLRRRVPSSV